ncbi:MAG: hypothetical protein WD015_01180 [Gaiellaceae bacterium]
MTPRILIITAVAATVVAVAAPAAWGDSWGSDRQGHADFWNYDAQTAKKTTNSSPNVAPQDLAALYSTSRSDVSVPIGSPDVIDRAVAARQNDLSTMLDSRERALGPKPSESSTPMLDARERALTEKREVQLGSGASADAFERAVAGRGSTIDRFVANDNRFRIDPSNNPGRVTVSASGREIEWPQIGIGFGVGIVLILGLLLAVRTTRHRPLAH